MGSGFLLDPWVWVKNRGTPKWNPGKWKQRLKPAVPWWLYFDPHPHDLTSQVDWPKKVQTSCLPLKWELGCRQIPGYKFNFWWVKWTSPLNTQKLRGQGTGWLGATKHGLPKKISSPGTQAIDWNQLACQTDLSEWTCTGQFGNPDDVVDNLQGQLFAWTIGHAR